MAQGGLDLAANRAQKVKIRAQVARPDALLGSQAKDIALGAVRLDGTLDGAFTDLSFAHVLTMESLRAGTYAAQGLRTEGTVRWNGHRLVVPLALTARQLRSGQATIDPYLPGARLAGDIVVEGKTISSDPLTLHLKGLDARMTLRGDLARGGYALAGPITARGLRVPNVGTLDGTAKISSRSAMRCPGRFRPIWPGGSIRLTMPRWPIWPGATCILRAARAWAGRCRPRCASSRSPRPSFRSRWMAPWAAMAPAA
jgi:translocation and assembly module TamB